MSTESPSLSEYYLITPDPQAVDRAFFLQQLEQSLQAGVRFVQLRAKNLPLADYKALAQSCLAQCQNYHAQLILNSHYELVNSLNASGAHLTGQQLMALDHRPLNSLNPSHLLGASCHNVEQLQKAERLGVNFVVLSPVNATPTHPQASPMGWDTFRALAIQISIPVYALGGVKPTDLTQAKQHGAVGIASVSYLWDIQRLTIAEE